MTFSPSRWKSAVFSIIAAMWSPSILMAAFGITFPLPGSIAVALTMMLAVGGAANTVEATVAKAISGRIFINKAANRISSIGPCREWKAFDRDGAVGITKSRWIP